MVEDAVVRKLVSNFQDCLRGDDGDKRKEGRKEGRKGRTDGRKERFKGQGKPESKPVCRGGGIDGGAPRTTSTLVCRQREEGAYDRQKSEFMVRRVGRGVNYDLSNRE